MPKSIGNKLKVGLERLRRKRNFGKDYKSALVCRKLELHVKNKVEGLRFRVAHITDQHVGRVTPMELQQAAISLINDAQPDVVLLTGDFVCHSDHFLEDLSFLLGQINAPAFAVLGNHDHWNDAPGVRRALQKASVEVLENANTIITINNNPLQLIGLDDAYTHHDDIEKAIKGMTKGIPTIGLSHIAEKAHDLWKHDVDLVLSGHTHAGQVTVARLNELILGTIARHEYIHGLYRNDKKGHPHQYVYVGAGVGSAIIPFRFGEKAKRETTIFEVETRHF